MLKRSEKPGTSRRSGNKLATNPDGFRDATSGPESHIK